MTRVEMAINRATVSAYVYSVLSLAFVYSLYLQQNVKLYVVAGFTILISYFVILLTGTRAAMGLYLLLAIVLTLYHFRKIHLKSALIFLCIVAGVVIVSYKPLISPKIKQTQREVERYQQGFDRTSLGARFSMWTVGIENGLAHPLGNRWNSVKRGRGSILKTDIRTLAVHSNTSKFICIMNLLRNTLCRGSPA